MRDAWRMSGSGTHGDRRRHLAFATGGEPYLVVGDVPGLDADHAAPGGVAQVGHRRALLGPRVPHHGRRGAVFLDHHATTPAAILDNAPRRRVQIDAISL